MLQNAIGNGNNNDLLKQNPNLVTIGNDNNQNVCVNEALGTKKQQSKRGKKKKGEQAKLENAKNKNGGDQKQEFLTLKLQKIDVEQKGNCEGNFENQQNQNHPGFNHLHRPSQHMAQHHHQSNDGMIQPGGMDHGAE